MPTSDGLVPSNSPGTGGRTLAWGQVARKRHPEVEQDGLSLRLNLDAIASDLGGTAVNAEPHQTEPDGG